MSHCGFCTVEPGPGEKSFLLLTLSTF